jgi:hypothetical protein
MSLRSYCKSTNRRSSLSRSIWSPTASGIMLALYASGDPSPKMHDTLATMITSRRDTSELVARSRNRSRSSLREASFSM